VELRVDSEPGSGLGVALAHAVWHEVRVAVRSRREHGVTADLKIESSRPLFAPLAMLTEESNGLGVDGDLALLMNV